MMLFVGLDISLEKAAVCVISEHGKIVKEAQVASEPEALLSWISDQDGAIAAVGLEGRALVAVAASRAIRGGTTCRADGNPASERCPEGHADQDGPS